MCVREREKGSLCIYVSVASVGDVCRHDCGSLVCASACVQNLEEDPQCLAFTPCSFEMDSLTIFTASQQASSVHLPVATSVGVKVAHSHLAFDRNAGI